MASNLDTIVTFFRGKGLNDAAIAGILGNLQVESGDNPAAYNANEGAIGIAQWEGSRRTALQQYAASTGRSETDLGAQLDFLWHELTTSESGVLQQLQTVGSAADAATIWDQGYERSAGTTRQSRISDAQAYYDSGLTSGGSGSGVSGSSASGAPAMTAADYEQALGPLQGLLTGVPELKSILSQAVKGGWSTTKFQQAVEASQWYRTNNSATRQLISLKYSDPAQYKAQMGQAETNIENVAHQMGINLTLSDVNTLAYRSITGSWDNNTLQDEIGMMYKGGGRFGQAAQYQQQLSQIYADYGFPTSQAGLDAQVEKLLSGQQTIDTYKQYAINSAKAMYPSFAEQLDQGLTIKDIAQPYIQTMANTLELDPNTLSLNDPLIKKALQGNIVTTNGKSTATSIPLYQFESTLRSDPRWDTTQNARDTVSSAIVHIGRDFGFSVG